MDYFPRISEAEAEELRRVLPVAFQDVARVIGDLNALHLVEVYGGRQLSVPAKCNQDHTLARLIGRDNVQALNRLIVEKGLGDGLRRIEVPRAAMLRNHLRRKAIVAAVEAGMSKREAAKRFDITTRAVRRIVNGR